MKKLLVIISIVFVISCDNVQTDIPTGDISTENSHEEFYGDWYNSLLYTYTISEDSFRIVSVTNPSSIITMDITDWQPVKNIGSSMANYPTGFRIIGILTEVNWSSFGHGVGDLYSKVLLMNLNKNRIQDIQPMMSPYFEKQ